MKFVTSRHDEGLRESQIEDILIDNPYLLRTNYQAVKRQVKFRDRTRADIIFYGTPTLVVELKRGKLAPADVRQIEHYMLNLQEEGVFESVGLLVGIDYDNRVVKTIQQTGLPIEARRLGIDVPTQLQMCKKCRKCCSTKYERCPYCKSYALAYWDSASGSWR